MAAYAVHDRRDPEPDVPETSLVEARECLAYWEERERRLPLHAVRGRREAREMTRRWEDRVARAEEHVYGPGLLGALLLLTAERRLPAPTRQAGRRVAHRAVQVAVAVAVMLAALLVAGVVAAIYLLSALIEGLT